MLKKPLKNNKKSSKNLPNLKQAKKQTLRFNKLLRNLNFHRFKKHKSLFQLKFQLLQTTPNTQFQRR